MTAMLQVRNWHQWQTKRKNRDGTPYVQPWIKVYRRLLQDPKWVALSDAERGQLVAIWMLAADRDGLVPADPNMLRKLCMMDAEPDIEVLVAQGFMERVDAALTPRQTSSGNVLKVGEERREEKRREEYNAREPRLNDLSRFNELYQLRPSGPVITAEGEYARIIDSGDVDHETLARRWPEYCRRQEHDGLRVANLANWLRRGGWADVNLDNAQAQTMGEFLNGHD